MTLRAIGKQANGRLVCTNPTAKVYTIEPAQNAMSRDRGGRYKQKVNNNDEASVSLLADAKPENLVCAVRRILSLMSVVTFYVDCPFFLSRFSSHKWLYSRSHDYITNCYVRAR